jgi:hypothetical protein
MAIGLITYQDGSRREDLIDVVTNVSPAETPLLSGLPMGPGAKQTLHEYTTATFASASSNAQVEGASFSAADLTQPSRSSNNTQIFIDNIQISGTMEVVDGVVNAKSYQTNKNLKEHAKDLELAFMAGSRASGSSGVARQMTGVINALTTNASTRSSGSSLGETTFNDIMELIYGSTNEVATEVYTGATLKRDISGFTAANTRNISADDRRLVRSVDVYESDFGLHKIFLHRDVPTGANAKMLVAINPEYHMQSWLRPTMVEELAKDGDRARSQIISEATLEHRGEATGAAVGGFTA